MLQLDCVEVAFCATATRIYETRDMRSILLSLREAQFARTTKRLPYNIGVPSDKPAHAAHAKDVSLTIALAIIEARQNPTLYDNRLCKATAVALSYFIL